MCQVEITIQHPTGLHARPASKFVQMASSFPCDIQIANLTKDTAPVNAKSILGVLSLGADRGHKIRIEANGENEVNAIDSLRSLVENNFGEAVPQ